MAESEKLSYPMHHIPSSHKAGQSVHYSPNRSRSGTRKEIIQLKSALLKFSSLIKENLRKDNPALGINIKISSNTGECILNGTENEVNNAKSELSKMERTLVEEKIHFPTNTTAALKCVCMEDLVCNLLKNDFETCVVEKVHNDIFLYGFDKNMIERAAKFVSVNILHEEKLLCGSLREKKEAVVDHFKKRYQGRIIVFTDEVCHLHLLGQKDAVKEALCEFVDLSEGRKSISPLKISTGKINVSKVFNSLIPEHFRFFNKSIQLQKKVSDCDVKISSNGADCSFAIQGEEEKVLKVVDYLNQTIPSLRTIEVKIPFFRQINILSLAEVLKCLHKNDCLLETKISYICGRSQVTNTLLNNVRSMWFSSGGRRLAIELSAFDDLCVDQKFKMKKRDIDEGNTFKDKGDCVVEIAVPDRINKLENDDNTVDRIINTALEKFALTNGKHVAFLISPFANWDFTSIMRCMVNSFIKWMVKPEAECFSVTLCVEERPAFVETDEYFGYHSWMKLKDFYCALQPQIKIIGGHLDKAEADVIVNTVSPNLDLRHGKVSSALFKAAGPDLQKECHSRFPHGITGDDIAVTSGYFLQCKNVFHITLQGERSLKGYIETIRKAMRLCLKTASDYKHRSIAFPAIGTGSLNYPKEEVASEMVMAMERLKTEYNKTISIKEVKIVIRPSDVDLMQTFQKMVDRLVNPKTEVIIHIELTGTETNVDKCKSWLESSLTREAQMSNSTHEQGKNVISPIRHKPDAAPSIPNHDLCNFNSTADRWSRIERANEIVKVKILKNTARDRPMTRVDRGSMQTANVPLFSNFTFENNSKMLVCQFHDGKRDGIKLRIYCDDIINLQDVDAVVCSENQAGNAKGIVARLLLNKGGKYYQQLKAKEFLTLKPKVGDIVTTQGGGNNYKYIIHAVMPRKNQEAIRKMYSKIFEEIGMKEFASVSLPLLGTGVGDVDPKTCSEMLLDELIQFCQSQRGDKLTLHLVINDAQIADIVKTICTKTIDQMNVSNESENPEERVDESFKDQIKKTEASTEIHVSQDNKVEAPKDCVICMDKVDDERKLPCGHIFCAECIEGYFKVRKVCPTCGKVCGIVTGDQPNGTMEVSKQAESVTGFEGHKSIALTYCFESGVQGLEHPRPGEAYKGIRRTAYLPDNKRGREICSMLIVAFERRLVFTIGTSRTTGKESVITWNDIHHKTDMRPNAQFGYPDETYLQRVGEELVVKGVSLKDVDQQLLKEIENDDFRTVITIDTKN